MKFSVNKDGDSVIVKIMGKLTAMDLDALKDGVAEAAEEWSDEEWVLDCSDLSYISSSGLRWLLLLQKKLQKQIHIIGVRQTVMDIFVLTGIHKLFPIEKGIRKISIKDSELMGRGANGEVYRLKDETIVKVFFPDEDADVVRKEDEISHVVFELGLPVVIPYDTVMVDGKRYGIVYETLGKKSLSETIEEDPKQFDEWIRKYADLYRLVHETDGSKSALPLAKDVYSKHLDESAEWYSKEEMKQLQRLLKSIPDRKTLVHGDFHPNNIMVQEGELIMIDLGDFSIGHPVFDFLATAATQANLVDLSPDYAEVHTRMKAERIRKGWSALLEHSFPDRTASERKKIDRQLRLFSKLKVACAPAVAKGISEELMRDSIEDVKKNLIPHVDDLIGTIDW